LEGGWSEGGKRREAGAGQGAEAKEQRRREELLAIRYFKRCRWKIAGKGKLEVAPIKE